MYINFNLLKAVSHKYVEPKKFRIDFITFFLILNNSRVLLQINNKSKIKSIMTICHYKTKSKTPVVLVLVLVWSLSYVYIFLEVQA